MPKQTHTFQKHITLLTCILRLRILPPIPYSTIASLLLDHHPAHVLYLAAKILPSSKSSIEAKWLKNEAEEWLANWLEEVLEREEAREGEVWVRAKEWSESDVRDVLKGCGFEGMGYGVISEDEVDVQVKWRREGDWRAGSVPLGRVVGEDIWTAVGWYSKPVSESLREIRKDRLAWEEKRSRIVKGSVYPVWNSFADQVEEIKSIEEALKEEGCERCEQAR